MRLVIQRVSRASVTVAGDIVGAIDRGFLVLAGVGLGDTGADAEWLAKKTAGLRVFEDAEGKMNLSLADAGGAALVVSQFTLYADCRKGNRPSFTTAAPPAEGERLYLDYVARLRAAGLTVQTGVFRADMRVELVNDGPVTICLDSADRPDAPGRTAS
jgi:D-tyrosyl-tRNA(Tyr) deacylase